MKTKNFSIKMNDGTEIWCNRWEPDSENEIKAVIQLHHGLAEHSMRYDRLGSILAEQGFVFNAFDMRGHGKTAEESQKNTTGIFGKIADKNGEIIAIEDLHAVIKNLKNEFPKKKIILLGHSCGSFISQVYVEKYDEIDGLILSGTAGPENSKMIFGKLFAGLNSKIFGVNHKSDFITKLAFMGYNKKVQNKKSFFDWLSKDEMNVSIYNEDQWCGFLLCSSFFETISKWRIFAVKKQNIEKINKNLPILMIYGSDDPVGNYGKSIEKLCKLYKNCKINNITLKKYEQSRHEILNDFDKEKVENDIIEWVNKII